MGKISKEFLGVGLAAMLGASSPEIARADKPAVVENAAGQNEKERQRIEKMDTEVKERIFAELRTQENRTADWLMVDGRNQYGNEYALEKTHIQKLLESALDGSAVDEKEIDELFEVFTRRFSGGVDGAHYMIDDLRQKHGKDDKSTLKKILAWKVFCVAQQMNWALRREMRHFVQDDNLSEVNGDEEARRKIAVSLSAVTQYWHDMEMRSLEIVSGPMKNQPKYPEIK